MAELVPSNKPGNISVFILVALRTLSAAVCSLLDTRKPNHVGTIRTKDAVRAAADGRVSIDVACDLAKNSMPAVLAPNGLLMMDNLPGAQIATEPRPKLNIVIQVVYSRGDVQSFVAIGTRLARDGHKVRLATHKVLSSLVKDSGLECHPVDGDPASLVAYMVTNPCLAPSWGSLRDGDMGPKRTMMAEMLKGF